MLGRRKSKWLLAGVPCSGMILKYILKNIKVYKGILRIIIMKTTIKVDVETRKMLNRAKIDFDARTIDETIKRMFIIIKQIKAVKE